MNPIPRGWISGTLGDFAEPTRVGVDPAAVPAMPYLGLDNVESVTTKILATVPASSVRSTSNRFGAGSTLYARLRPYLNKVCAPTFDGIGSGEFIIFSPSPILAPGFLKYLLNQPAFVDFTATLGTGDRPRVNWAGIAKFPCALPPLAEQERIVATVEEQFSRLDAGLAAVNNVRERLSSLRAAVLQAAVSGRLVPQRPDDEPAQRWLDEQGKVATPSPSPADLPLGWVRTSIGSLKSWSLYGPRFTSDDYVSDGVPCYGRAT